MSAQIKIREANENDLSLIITLYKELSDEPLEFEKVKQSFNKIKNYPDCTIYVAEENGKMIGTFLLLILDTMAHGKPSAVIEDVAVVKEYQGKGIGKLMMKFAVEKCNEKGCYKAALSSQFKREAAHKFYESLGFEKMGLQA